MTWTFHLQALPSLEWISHDVPLVGAQVTTACNAPASISGSLPFEMGQLKKDDGTLAIREWGTKLIAEQEGREPIAGIVDHLAIENGALRVEAGGFSMYPTAMPWLGADYAGIKVDPLDLVRKIWDHVQSYPDGDLGVVVDSLKSPVRIGTPERDVNFTTKEGQDVSFTTGPEYLNWWTTDDLGKVLSDLAVRTPFQYRERSAWAGEDITHRLQLGYPRLGARKPDLRFEIGLNVTAAPAIQEGDYASTVLVLGSGEGRKKATSGPISTPTTRLRRVRVHADSSITSKAGAQTAARPVLEALNAALEIDTIDVTNHTMAPFGTFEPGDEIYVTGDAGWAELNTWVRILDMTTDVDKGTVSMKVEAT